MTSEPQAKASGKMLLWDYDSLLTLSDEDCSYCLSARDVAMLIAPTEYMGWKTRYWSSSGLPIDQDLIDSWRASLERKLMSGCGCGPQPTRKRVNPENGHLQESFDDGVTWQDVSQSEDPRYSSPQYAPPSDLPPPGADRRCEVANNIVGFCKSQTDKFIADGGAWTSIEGLAAAFLAILVVLDVLSLGALTPVIVPAIIALQAGGLAAFSAAMTGDVYDQFRCIVYCALPDTADVSEETWQTIKSQINANFTGIAQVYLFLYVNSAGVVGLQNMGDIVNDSPESCDGCDCGDDCAASSQEPYFSFGTVLSVTGSTVRVQSELFTPSGGGSPFWLVSWGEYGIVGDRCCYIVDVVPVSGGSWTGSQTEFTGCTGIVTPNHTPVGETLTHFSLYPTGQVIFDITFPS